MLDFPGITILQYAGNGKFSTEEDYRAGPSAAQATRCTPGTE